MRAELELMPDDRSTALPMIIPLTLEATTVLGRGSSSAPVSAKISVHDDRHQELIR